MKEGKPKSIRTIGIVIAVISALTILSNLLGLLLANTLLVSAKYIEEVPYLNENLTYVKPIALLSTAIFVVAFVAGVFIMRYKNWARKLVQIIVVIYLLFFWYQAVFIAPNNPFDKGEFGFENLIGALVWSVPIILLVTYLNKEKVKSHFV